MFFALHQCCSLRCHTPAPRVFWTLAVSLFSLTLSLHWHLIPCEKRSHLCLSLGWHCSILLPSLSPLGILQLTSSMAKSAVSLSLISEDTVHSLYLLWSSTTHGFPFLLHATICHTHDRNAHSCYGFLQLTTHKVWGTHPFYVIIGTRSQPCDMNTHPPISFIYGAPHACPSWLSNGSHGAQGCYMSQFKLASQYAFYSNRRHKVNIKDNICVSIPILYR